MQLSEYEEAAAKTAIFPQEQGLTYCVLGLTNEAGEVAGKLKKSIRDGTDRETLRNQLIDEAGDVFWYVTMLVRVLGSSLEEMAARNLEKLNSRAERGMIGGSGDKR